MVDPDVTAHYELGLEESRLFVDGRPRLEYVRTLEAEALASGLRDVRLYSIEGPAWMLENSADLESQLFVARASESEPALMAATSHFMVVGKTS